MPWRMIRVSSAGSPHRQDFPGMGTTNGRIGLSDVWPCRAVHCGRTTLGGRSAGGLGKRETFKDLAKANDLARNEFRDRRADHIEGLSDIANHTTGLRASRILDLALFGASGMRRGTGDRAAISRVTVRSHYGDSSAVCHVANGSLAHLVLEVVLMTVVHQTVDPSVRADVGES
jgi:hypothetical protein